VYQQWLANFTMVAATVAVVIACVLVHYEGLSLTQRRIMRPHRYRRGKVLHAISLVILLHILEIWIFGLAYWLLLKWADSGTIHGAQALHLFDYIYFSATSFTTLGFGDLVPVGPVRFLAATEGLVGLVLITWSASFTYLEMESFWRDGGKRG
jgi:hypothetical protein